jgi:acyl-CoA thioester hydrolase
MTAPKRATVRLRVPFCDVDSMHVVWHGNYFKYFDAAREALFDQAGIDLYRMRAEDGLAVPVTRSQVKHIRPLRHRDEFDCTAQVVEARCRLVLAFEIRLVTDGALCVKAQVEQVSVRFPEGNLELSLPDAVRAALDSSDDPSLECGSAARAR